MSNKVIQFNKGNEEEFCCPVCEIVNEYVQVAQQLESEEQLFELLSDLFAEGMKHGLVDYLKHELDAKVSILDHLEYGSECDCDECDCELED